MSDKRRRARGGNFVTGFININKYTSASENVHLCLKNPVNWVTLVSLLIEYLLYSMVICALITPPPLEESYAPINLKQTLTNKHNVIGLLYWWRYDKHSYDVI